MKGRSGCGLVLQVIAYGSLYLGGIACAYAVCICRLMLAYLVLQEQCNQHDHLHACIGADVSLLSPKNSAHVKNPPQCGDLKAAPGQQELKHLFFCMCGD